MLEKDKIALRDASPYNAAITREQFLFYEVRTTARRTTQIYTLIELGLLPRHICPLEGQHAKLFTDNLAKLLMDF